MAARDRSAEPEARALRLFVAVNIPDDVKAGVAEAIEPFRDRIPGARWTRREGWHVTLKFLGATWPRMVEPVKEAVGTAAARASEPSALARSITLWATRRPSSRPAATSLG